METLQTIKTRVYTKDLSNNKLQAPRFQTFEFVDLKNKYALQFLSSRCPTLFDEACGSKFKAHFTLGVEAKGRGNLAMLLVESLRPTKRALD